MTAEVDGLIEELNDSARDLVDSLGCPQCGKAARAIYRLQRELQEQRRLVEGLAKTLREYPCSCDDFGACLRCSLLMRLTGTFPTDAAIKEK